MESKDRRIGRVLVTGRERDVYTHRHSHRYGHRMNTHRVRESGTERESQRASERETEGRQFVRRNILGPFGILTIEIRRRRYHGELKILVPAPKEAEVITSAHEHHNKVSVCECEGGWVVCVCGCVRCVGACVSATVRFPRTCEPASFVSPDASYTCADRRWCRAFCEKLRRWSGEKYLEDLGLAKGA